MKKERAREQIEETGIIPAVRVSSAEEARFAAEAVYHSGIPIAEITMTVPGAAQVIYDLTQDFPEMIVGAGTILDAEMARCCIEAGAKFLTSTGLDRSVVELGVKEDVVVMPGALTPTEVINAWKAGADLVKVFPCAQLGGVSYLKALRAPLPQVRFVAAGGVSQATAAEYILAGAAAVGVGQELIPKKAVQLRQVDWIRELARRFVELVKNAREQMTAKK